MFLKISDILLEHFVCWKKKNISHLHSQSAINKLFSHWFQTNDGIIFESNKFSASLKELTTKHDDVFHFLNCFHLLFYKKTNLNCIKKYMKIKVFVVLICHVKNMLIEFTQYLKLILSTLTTSHYLFRYWMFWLKI